MIVPAVHFFLLDPRGFRLRRVVNPDRSSWSILVKKHIPPHAQAGGLLRVRSAHLSYVPEGLTGPFPQGFPPQRGFASCLGLPERDCRANGALVPIDARSVLLPQIQPKQIYGRQMDGGGGNFGLSTRVEPGSDPNDALLTHTKLP